MPALITHHLFGEQAAQALPDGIVTSDEELLAFLIGNQGPDPFFFHFTDMPTRVVSSVHLAQEMHRTHMSAALNALHEGVSHLHVQDARIGRAFASGMLAHYALDRQTHPFIYAQEFALMEANPELAHAGSEVHAVIESDLDSWMLWHLHHETVRDCPPSSVLECTHRIYRVAGALTSHMSLAVFHLPTAPTLYGASVANMDFVYRHIEPAGSQHTHALGQVERLVRQHSQLEALAHRVTADENCAAANLEHHTWLSPATHKQSRASFIDLYTEALTGWPHLFQAFAAGGDTLKQAVGRLNYAGEYTNDAETLVTYPNINKEATSVH